MARTSKNSTASPTKRAAKPHNQMSSEDINECIPHFMFLLVAALIAVCYSLISKGILNNPITPTSSPRKRKNVVFVSDDESSGIEIVSGPQPSPKKARAATPPPSPGTSAYKELPAVSISDMLENLTSPGSSIAFGTTGRPTRTKVKTEKGAVLEQLKTTRITRSRAGKSGGTLVEPSLPSAPAPVTPPTSQAPLPCSSPFPDLLYPESPIPKSSTKSGMRRAAKHHFSDKDVDMLSPSPTKDLRKRREASPGSIISDDELPLVSELLLSPQKKSTDIHANVTKPLSLKEVMDTEAVEANNASDQSSEESDHYLATDDDGDVGFHTEQAPAEQDSSSDGDTNGGDNVSDGDDEPDDPDAVTSTVYQDPALRKIYKNLPFLPKLCPIIPYAQSGVDTTSDRYVFSTVAKTLTSSEANSLLQAMLFTQSDVYVNLSRIHPNLLQKDSGRIRMKRADNAAALAMYTGICTKSVIIGEELVGPPSALYPVHGISVAGSDQETRRYMAMLGVILGHEKITGNMARRGLSFYTRGQGKNGNFNYSPIAQPMSSSSPLSSLLSSVALPAPVINARGYPASRSFDDKIPIYDGREESGRKFEFSEANFRQLHSWPLYRRGKVEVEEGTVVSVGHTIGSYHSAQGGHFLSTNIHFVIVLGKPAIGL